MSESLAVQSPDRSAAGLVAAVDPLRYDGLGFADPYEVPGLFRALMPSGVRVLDIGCGAGNITVLANAGKGNEVLGVEPDAARADAARRRGIAVEQCLFDAAFIARHEPFDVIMASDVLEHVSDPAHMLALFALALKPGGRVIVSVPNVAHWSVRLALLFGRFDYQPVGIMDATHLRWFTTRSLTRLFQTSGYAVRSIHHSAGAWMDQYERAPFTLLPRKFRFPALRRGVRLLPTLLGCQLILEAQSPGGPTSGVAVARGPHRPPDHVAGT